MMPLQVGDKVRVLRGGDADANKLEGLEGEVSATYHPRYHVCFRRKVIPQHLLLWAGDPVGPYSFNIIQLEKL
jgi:hypothetical protein